MKPAGFENSQGIITAPYLMDPTDKQWDDNADMKAWRAWMDKWMPGANKADANYIFGYAVAVLMHETLKKCGDDLTRDNLMKQAANFQKFRLPLLLPGHHRQHQPDRLLPDPGGAACALQGRDLGAVRRRHVGRKLPESQLGTAFTRSGRPPAMPAAFHLRLPGRDFGRNVPRH